MVIRDCMKKNVYSLPVTATVRDAVEIFVTRHIGLLPVIDEKMQYVGVIGLRDILILALPSALNLIDDVDFIGDFGAIESFRPSDLVLSRPIKALMRHGTVVKEDSGLVRAYSLMVQHDLHDLPVVDQEGHLIGIASRVDIGTSILAGWR